MTDAGAIAFVRFYLKQINEAWSTPDPDLLTGLAAPTCGSCAFNASFAKDLAAAGQRVDGPSMEVKSLRIRNAPPVGQTQVEAKLRQLAVRVVDANGTVLVELPPDDLSSIVSLTWKQGRWWVVATAEAEVRR